MSKAVTKSESPTVEVIEQEFRCLTTQPEKLTAMIRENLGSQTLSPFDLDRVKIPSGGALSWTVPGLKGEESHKEIQGIIIYFKDVRSYWPGQYDGGSAPPDCSSNDGIVGTGRPGGSCEQCPNAQFGSDHRKIGQACKSARLLFIMRETDIIPLVIALSPMSIGPCRKHFLR